MDDKIKTADECAAVTMNEGMTYKRFCEQVIYKRYRKTIAWDKTVGVVMPRVNHGRWIIDCPLCDSAGDAHNTLNFVCLECGNKGTGIPMKTIWPNDRGAIERELMRRPNENTRNWDGIESFAHLVAENILHKVS